MLVAARDLGIAPWVLEAECTERWWLWWVEEWNARAEGEKAKAEKLRRDHG